MFFITFFQKIFYSFKAYCTKTTNKLVYFITIQKQQLLICNFIAFKYKKRTAADCPQKSYSFVEIAADNVTGL